MLEHYSSTEKGNPQSYRATKKACATFQPIETLKREKFNQMYLEQLCLAINIAGWSVTKIYSHYTFEQECSTKKLI